jgi:hypothetical protein
MGSKQSRQRDKNFFDIFSPRMIQFSVLADTKVLK